MFVLAPVGTVALAAKAECDPFHSSLPVHDFNDLVLRQDSFDVHLAIANMHQIADSLVSVGWHFCCCVIEGPCMLSGITFLSSACLCCSSRLSTSFLFSFLPVQRSSCQLNNSVDAPSQQPPGLIALVARFPSSLDHTLRWSMVSPRVSACHLSYCLFDYLPPLLDPSQLFCAFQGC